MATESRHVQEALLGEFAAETLENISSLRQERLTFQQNPDDRVTTGNFFRLVHTIRGTCGFLGLPQLEKLAQATEEALDKLRHTTSDVAPPVISLLLLSLDHITTMLGYISQNGQEKPHDDSLMIDQLIQLADTGMTAATAPVSTPPAETQAKKIASDKQDLTSFLLFISGLGNPKAVPLELVVRLDKIDVKTIEIVGDSPVVYYEEDLMSLITLDDTLNLPARGLAQVIIFNCDNKFVGLVVEEILDTVLADAKPGDSIFISGKTADIVDVVRLLSAYSGIGV